MIAFNLNPAAVNMLTFILTMAMFLLMRAGLRRLSDWIQRNTEKRAKDIQKKASDMKDIKLPPPIEMELKKRGKKNDY